jgi:hypothetical protein
VVRIKNTKVYGLYESIYRGGFPIRYGEPIDMEDNYEEQYQSQIDTERAIILGNLSNDLGNNNFLKGIIVQFDLCYPQYYNSQFLETISSQSKINFLTKKDNIKRYCNKYVDDEIIEIENKWIKEYNNFKKSYEVLIENSKSINNPLFREITFNPNYPKNSILAWNGEWYTEYELFMKVISNLPMGFELWGAVSTNYFQLKVLYNQRKNDILEEDWGYFCKWIKDLPMFKELVLSYKG